MEKIYLFEAIGLLPEKLRELVLEETMSETYTNDLLSFIKKDYNIPYVIDRSVNYSRSKRGASFWNGLIDKLLKTKAEDMDTVVENFVRDYIPNPHLDGLRIRTERFGDPLAGLRVSTVHELDLDEYDGDDYNEDEEEENQ